MQSYKEAAQEYFNFLFKHASTEDCWKHFHSLEKGVEKGCFVLTAEDFKDFRVQIRKDHARGNLRALREGIGAYREHVGSLRELMEKGGFSLADLGTTEEELEFLRVREHKVIAQGYLKSLRKGDECDYETHQTLMKMHLEENGLSLTDIGASEDELKSLIVQNAKYQAKFWLKRLRQGKNFHTSLDFMKKNLQSGGLTFMDIGTGEEEIVKLKKKL